MFADRIKDSLLGGVVGLHQEVDAVQLSHPATEKMGIDYVLTTYLRPIFSPNILLRFCELIILKAEAVNEVFTHLLHLVIRKPL